jgi:Fe-coproporphyrin III synthase
MLIDKDFEDMAQYILSKRWILRRDPAFHIQHSIYDIYENETLKISDILFVILKIWEQNILDCSEMYSYLSSKGIFLDKKDYLNCIEELKKNQIIIPFKKGMTSKYSEKNHDFEIDNHKVPVASTPYDVEVHLTNRCNLKCLHCMVDAGHKKNDELPWENWIEIFDYLEHIKVHHIILSGGEPLLYPGSKYLLNHLATKSMRIDILTNGTLIDEEFAKSVNKPNFSVSVSLDGSDAQKHDNLRGVKCFDKVLDALKLLSTCDVNFSISTTLNRTNIKQIEDLIKLSIRLNAKSIGFITLEPAGRAKDRYDLILTNSDLNYAEKEIKKYKAKYDGEIDIVYIKLSDENFNEALPAHHDQESDNIFCTGGTSKISIRSDGSVFPCALAFDVDEFKMGSLISQNLLEIWRSPKWRSFRGAIHLKDLSQCNKCETSKSCTLKFCRLRAYYNSGDLLGTPCHTNFSIST